MIYEPLIGSNAANVDYSKFGYLGSMAQSTAIYVSWHTSKIKTARDLLDREMLRMLGVQPEAQRIIVVKSSNPLPEPEAAPAPAGPVTEKRGKRAAAAPEAAPAPEGKPERKGKPAKA